MIKSIVFKTKGMQRDLSASAFNSGYSYENKNVRVMPTDESTLHILLNHNWDKDLGSTKQGNLELNEDSIGLMAKAVINDREVIEKARNGDLVGWSFGFTDRDVDTHSEDGMTTRDVKDLDLYEVSILDRTRTPAYEGTMVSVRSDENIYHGSLLETEIEIRDESKPEEKHKDIDYSKAENLINEMKGEN